MTYAATRSSALERAKRNENGERNMLERLCIGAIVSLCGEAEIDGGPLRRESRSRRRRRRGRRDDRRLDRAQAGRRVGGRARGQSAAPLERRAASRRLFVRGLRAGRLSNGRERNARRRSERVRKRWPTGTSPAVHARRDAEAPRALVLRAPLDLARKLRFSRDVGTPLRGKRARAEPAHSSSAWQLSASACDGGFAVPARASSACG